MRLLLFLVLSILPWFLKAQECDIIIYNDGTEISSIVQEIRLNEIAYKKCDNPSGPLYVVQKSEVFMIRYKNGTKEIIKHSSNIETNAPKGITASKQTLSFSNLTEEDKNEIIKSGVCFKIVNKSDGSVFDAKIESFKKISIAFIHCSSNKKTNLNNIYIDYIESSDGFKINFQE